MVARTRLGALALSLALVLGLTGSVVVLRPAAVGEASDPATSAPRDPSPQVVPDRYLVQTAGTPTALGGNAKANARAQAALLDVIAQVGATVDHRYDATWTGLSITATREQLDRITAAGVEAVFPVYRVSLDDAVAFATETAADPAGGSAEPTADPTAAASTDPMAGSPAAATAGPLAAADEFTVGYLVPTGLDVLGNDAATPDQALRPDSLVLTDPGADPGGARLHVEGRGTFTVTDGQVTFTSAAGWTGTLEPVAYQVSDTADATASATLTVTVPAPPDPVAVADSGRSTAGAPVSVDVLANDAAGGATTLQDPCLPDGEGCPATRATTDGAWTVAGRVVTFVPAGGFVGTGTVTYRVGDELGRTAEATLSVTVHAAPAASDHAATTDYLVGVAVDVLDDQQDPAAAEPDPESLVLVGADGSRVDELVVAAEGGYTAGDDGRISFTPARGFTGETTPLAYEFSDALGAVARALLRVTVTPPAPPAALADTADATAGEPVVVDVLANDDAFGGAGLDPATVCLVVAGECVAAIEDPTGSWAVTPAGRVGFTPAPDTAGHPGVTYRVSDELGRAASATLTVSVDAAPRALDDTATIPQGVPTSLTPLANDRPGQDADDPGTEVPFDPTTLVLDDGGQTGTVLTTVAGTWSADHEGTVRFAPVATFTGDATIGYRVHDTNGSPVRASITVSVTAVAPRAGDDAAAVPARHEATVRVLANDVAGDPEVPLDPASLVLTDPDATADGTSAVTADGTWRVDAGTVRFSPDDGFHGATAETTYRVADTNGTTTQATVQVRVGVLTVALTSQAATAQNQTVTLFPLADVVIGDDGNGVAGTVDPALLSFGADALDDGRTLVVQGEGTWRIDPATGEVSFDPESAFAGTATAGYRLTDSFGNAVSAALRVVVDAVVPQLTADDFHTAAHNPVSLAVLDNDLQGHPSAPLQPDTVALLDAEPATAGTWAVPGDGTLVFTPATGFSGTVRAYYTVRDANNTMGFAGIDVSVGELPQAVADTPSTPQDGRMLTVDPTANDVAGDDGTGARFGFRAASLVLTDPAATTGGKQLATDSWTWRVNANTVEFTASWRFTGTVTTGYRVTDSFGNETAATITVTVTPTATTATEHRLAAIGALAPGTGGSGVKVAVIDSGIDYRHPDLGGSAASTFPTARVTAGFDFVDGDADPADCYSHGTHVAGLVGANGNPKAGGALGVAPEVTLGAYRVFDCEGVSDTAAITAAMERAHLDGMNVVNLSLGATSVSWPDEEGYPLSQAAATLVENGVVVVASVGNTDRGLFTAGSPAVAPGVIAVAATNAAATHVEDYSAIGPAADLSLSPTLSAPGTDVYSSVPEDGRDEKSGTSMAAPEVAGAVAEILTARGWTNPAAGVPAKVAALLYASASPLLSATSGLTTRPESVVRQGAGLLQLDAALATTVTASPSVLRLSEGTTETTTVTLRNSGSEPVSYRASATTGTSAAASTSGPDRGNQSPDWAWGAVGFSASPATVTVPANGAVTVKLTISAPRILSGRDGLLYGGWVQFTASGARTVSVPFVGVRGDYQDVKMLPRGKRSFTDAGTEVAYTLSLPTLARRSSTGSLLPIRGSDPIPTFRQPDQANQEAVVMFHLDYPASAIRLKATNKSTKKSYYAVLSGTDTWLGKRGRDESFSAIEFYGIYKTSGGKLAYIPSGTYTLKLRVLRPLGKSSTSSHWETYTSRTLKLRWS